MIAYIFSQKSGFQVGRSLTRYFQSRKSVMFVLHLLVKIDYITALVQLLGRELHDLSNRNVNKPPKRGKTPIEKLRARWRRPLKKTLPLKKKYIYIFSRLDWIENFSLGRKIEAANTRGNHGWKNERGWKNGEQPAARFHCVYF